MSGIHPNGESAFEDPPLNDLLNDLLNALVITCGLKRRCDKTHSVNIIAYF
jgi:hypothetical protein